MAYFRITYRTFRLAGVPEKTEDVDADTFIETDSGWFVFLMGSGEDQFEKLRVPSNLVKRIERLDA